VVLGTGTVLVLAVAVAGILGWTSTSHAMPPINQQATVSEAAVRPALDLSQAFTNLAEVVTPSVVRIESQKTAAAVDHSNIVPEQFRRWFEDREPEMREPQPQLASGSGFVVSTDGYILTNNHVVDGATDVRVYFPDRRYYSARIIGADPFTDVAVIKVDVDEELPAMAIGDSDDIDVGEWILAIGNPGFGSSTQLDFTVTAGIISARGRGLSLLQRDLQTDPRYGVDAAGYAIEDFIQTDAVINPGNSGGPMVNLRGQVVGINSAIASTTGVYQGYGFAIPINLARRVMEDLVEYGHVRRPRLGVSISEISPEDAEVYGLPTVSGVFVQDVPGDGPATGVLRQEDVIVALDGQPVGYVSELQSKIAERRPGDRVRVTIYREGSPRDLEIRLGEAPINAMPTAVAAADVLAEERLGINIEALDAEAAARLGFADPEGVVLTDVAPGSAAARRGVATYLNYKLAQINDTEIRSAADVRGVLSEVQTGQIVSLHFRHPNGTERVVNVRMP
jgi:serine protease Do